MARFLDLFRLRRPAGARGSFHDRVGTGEDVATRAPQLDRCLEWCRRLNRERQKDEIRKRIEVLRAAGAAVPPLLVIIPGAANSGHSLFMKRFSEQDLRDILGDSRPYDPACDLVRWPADAESVDDLHDAMRCWLRGDLATAPLETCLADYGKSLCFGLLVDSYRWNADKGRLVRAWVEDMMTWRPMPNGNVLICLLGFELPGHGTTSFDPMTEFLEEQSARDESVDRVLVIPELDPVRHIHFDEWLAWVRGQDRELAQRLEAAKMDIFGPDLTPASFVKAHNCLVHWVHHLCGAPLLQYPRVP